MLKNKIHRLIKEFGVKKVKIAEVIGITRIELDSKIKDNSFSDEQKLKFKKKYGKLFVD